MNKRNFIGIAISVMGLFIIGYELGKNAKTGENNTSLTFTGLFIVFAGVFVVTLLNKKKSNK